MIKSAIISPDKKYRYLLTRSWDATKPILAFVGLNPSTADAVNDDNTIRWCIRHAKLKGYGAMFMLNIFAYRSTDPKKLYDVEDPIGKENDKYLITTAAKADRVVIMWGNHGMIQNRGLKVAKMLRDFKIKTHALRLTKTRQPYHPLYLKTETEPFVVELI